MFVYVLKSKKTNRYYVGCTADIMKRLKQHNSEETKSTRYGCPWELICHKQFDSQEQTYLTEKLVKSYKGGNAFKKITNGELAEWSKAPHC